MKVYFIKQYSLYSYDYCNWSVNLCKCYEYFTLIKGDVSLTSCWRRYILASVGRSTASFGILFYKIGFLLKIQSKITVCVCFSITTPLLNNPLQFRSGMEEFHGPYIRGMGRRSPSVDFEENGGLQEGKSPVFFSPQSSFRESPANKRPRITHLDTEVIPKFDPARKNVNVIGWLHKIDQLGDIYNWEERDRVFVMQTRLRGAARDWYDDLEDYSATWDTWKEWLTKAFPRTTDFVDRLEEMLARHKGNETMTRYYHDKISLMKKCGLDGENAMSCLIRGLPVELRANAKACGYKTPEELYYGFLSSLENYGAEKNRRSSDQKQIKSTWQRGSAAGNPAPKVCYNCRRPGHEARDCRAAPATRCQVCQRAGHAANTCWYAAGGSSRDTSAPPQRNQQVRQVYHVTTEIISDVYRKQISINGFEAIGYIDTGSKVNIITMKVIEKSRSSIMPSNVVMRGFGGLLVISLGKASIDLVIDNISLQTCAEITNANLNDIDLIVGQPIINQPNLNLIITCKSVKLIANGAYDCPLSTIRLSSQDFITKVPLFLLNNVEVLPGSSAEVRVYTSYDLAPSEILVTHPRLYSMGDESYYIPELVLKNTPTFHLRVINLGDSCLQWSAGRLITRADMFTQTDVAFVTSSCAANSTQDYDQPNKTFVLSELDIGEMEEKHSKLLLDLLNKYPSCFAESSSELGCTDLIDMHISTTSETPVFCKPYRLSYKENEIVQEKVNDLLSAGIVRESNSEYASPVILVKKKGGDYRLCIDYRALNARTVKDRFPLPHIDDQINRLSGKMYFTVLDMAQSYYQVKMAENSIHKTAFITSTGQYEFLKMPFGLANAPAVFSRLIRKALGSLDNKIATYLDDVTLPTVTIEEGIDLLEDVLKLLSRANLKLNLTKCSFLKTSVNYLGHEVTEGSVRPGQEKITSVINFRQPRNVHELRQFIGLASYFRKFVRGFAEIARPLTSLTKKDVAWMWGSEQEYSFNLLKSTLTERPVLAIYDPHAKTEIHTDASSLGLGGILLQYQNNGELKPVAYFSRVTSREEMHYHSYELETLAVVESLKRFRIYVTGIPVKVITDCAALRTTLTKKDLIPRIARWWLTIQDFDIEIEYRPGHRMQHVDALSRNPVESVTVLRIDEADWRLTLQLQDDTVQSIIRQINAGTNNPDINKNYTIVNGCLFRKTLHGDRFVIPKLSKWSLLQKYHDQVGHIGFEKCEKTIKSKFWFSGMTRFIRKYVNACLHCAYAKGNYGKVEGELHPIEKVAIPMHTLHMDHLGPFLKTRRGYSYILVIIDSFTKFVFARAVKGTGSIETIQNLKEIISTFGNPHRIVTDRGVAFTSRYFKEFSKLKQFKHVLNAVACPRSNGQVERVNRTIVNGLNTTAESECTWDEKLADVVWGINNSPHAVTGFSPFSLMFSHDNSLLPAYPANVDSNIDPQKQLLERRHNAKLRIDNNMAIMKGRYDKRHKKCRKYNVGELVLWKGGLSRDHTVGVTKKLGSVFTGPYKITKTDHTIDRYTINSIQGVKGYKKFNAVVAGDSLRPYKSSVPDSSTDSDHEIDRDDLIDLLES